VGRTTRTLVVLVIALAAAAAAAYAVYRAIQQIPVREVEVASVEVVVASRAVPLGTMLTSSDVRLVKWPAQAQVPGSFGQTSQVVNHGTVAPLEENEIITAGKLAAEGAGAGLPPRIPVGMRAISVKVNEVIGVAGFVVPGTRVDLLVTVSQQNNQETISRLVVSNLEVLAAGTRYEDEQSRSGGKAIPTTVVTLLATPEDSERIALAQTEGRVMLVLRNPLDVAPVETAGIRMTALVGPPAPPPVERKSQGKRVMVAQKPPPSEPAKPKPYTVEAIRAAKRTEEPIR